MINIEEKISSKLPGVTSLFISFPYKKELIDIIKNISSYNWDKNTSMWEVPITELSYLLDEFCEFDSINLKLLKDEVREDKKFEIGPFKTTPLPHQEEGIQYGLNHDKFLLLDVPGAGKTLQIIYIASELKKLGKINHCLIICGINTLKYNWKKEIEKHSDLPCRVIGEKITKKGTVYTKSVEERLQELSQPIDEFFVITNVETLREDKIVKVLNESKYNSFDMIVVDEIHKCANTSSKQGKNLLKLKNANHKIGATGTLLLNSPEDAYAALKFIDAEKVSLTSFKNYYCTYINRIVVGYKNLDVLKYQLEKFSIRRTKDILNLPPKTVIKEYVEMEPIQRNFYNNIEAGIVEEVDKVELNTTSLLAMISRLRQATALPSILTTEPINSAKLDRCCDLVDEIVSSGEKVVIFSTYKDPVYELGRRLSKYKANVNTGDISDETINKNIEDFQTDPEHKVFIGTYAKCATGITLNAATYMICLDQCWTAAQDLQAQDRIHRVGTKNPVFIYDLITKDTIDERVDEIVQNKSALGDYLIDDIITPQGLELLRKYIKGLGEK